MDFFPHQPRRSSTVPAAFFLSGDIVINGWSFDNG